MDKLVFQIFSAFLLIISPNFVHGETITSCSQTPYPEICNHYMSTNFLASLEVGQTQFSFRDLTLSVTRNQAIQAHKLISNMDLSSFNKLAKSAWYDCLELYDDTVSHLNRSMSSSNSIDSVTWLSAAIANQQTCKNGFVDFNLDSHLLSLPLMLGNFSKLLSNSLAITKSTIISTTSTTSMPNDYKRDGGRRRLLVDGFPTWISGADRKLLQSTAAATTEAHIVVAQDGSGNYKTISQAVAAAKGGKRFVIHVKRGVYIENVEIKKSMKNIMIIGDGIDATIVTGSKNVVGGSTTYRSATFAVSGNGFIARDITFKNTAGPQNHQAVALRSDSDFSVFYRCSFKGYEDTLYVYSQRQFYRNCDIYGTADFIFGDAVAVFQNCNIYIRKPMRGQYNSVTAQGRKDPNENTGIVIHNSRITASSDMRHGQGSFESYLGRPWKEYSRTVFMKCVIDGLINPAGWSPYNGDFALSTLYFAEYMNTGNGASTSRRVKWPGYHVLRSPRKAGEFAVANFLSGNSWMPATGVPFDSGL